MRRRGSIMKRCEHPRQQWSRCRHGWYVVVGTTDGNGKRKQIWRAVPTGVDPEAELTRLLALHDSGKLSNEARTTTVAAYLTDTWIPHIRTRIRPQTAKRYEQIVRDDILPLVGDVRLSKLKPADVQAVVDAAIGRGLSARSIVQTYRVLASSLAQAVRWELLDVNPAKAIRPPRIERAELTVPTTDQVKAIMGQAEGTWLYLPILLAATTGMRRGEVFALRWRDVDLDAGALQRHRVSGARCRWSAADRRDQDRRRRGVRCASCLPSLIPSGHTRSNRTQRRLFLGEGWTEHRPCDRARRRHPARPRHRDAQVRWLRRGRWSAGRSVPRPAARLRDDSVVA